ncbi:zincin-like metallopeptidase domain-containing protein [Mucilaginibacter celer]|uniref:DUF1738 domain-containing protein n=1 Tax=Mucilaginibacter celer TaxID=2305508 RepID=A0A494VWG7_9SPHI|nr:zincin-like metallopeptidase domain-containing protein [Mucilaginibacter celer]AYL95332.1 DUF1738 domain-containing protein [Mucilaginibacter celer]
MSKNFKSLPVQLSEKLITEIKEGKPLFQKPVKENGMPAFVKPLNPSTGKGYSAMNALILGMKRYDDPRWLTADAARFAGSWVKEGEKGTMIEFQKTSDIQAIRTAEGQKIKDGAGVTQTKTVEFDKPQSTKSFLFNAEQMKDVTPLKDFLARQQEGDTLTPLQKAEKLIADSKAVIIEGGQEAYYDKIRDAIFVPEKSHFENETKYAQAVIHQLSHWAGHESRLNRPMEGKFGSMEYAKEEMRAAIAAIIIGGELKVGHNFGHQAAYMNNFTKILREDPFEIAKASRDAQKIANLLLGTNLKREQKQQTEVAFKQGDRIDYMDTTYKVLETYKNKSIRVEDSDGARKTLKPDYGLYKSLLEAKRDPLGNGQAIDQTKSQSTTTEQEFQLER